MESNEYRIATRWVKVLMYFNICLVVFLTVAIFSCSSQCRALVFLWFYEFRLPFSEVPSGVVFGMWNSAFHDDVTPLLQGMSDSSSISSILVIGIFINLVFSCVALKSLRLLRSVE